MCNNSVQENRHQTGKHSDPREMGSSQVSPGLPQACLGETQGHRGGRGAAAQS